MNRKINTLQFIFLGMISMAFVGTVFFAEAYAQTNTTVGYPSNSQSSSQADNSSDIRGPFLGSNPSGVQNQTNQPQAPAPQPSQTGKKMGAVPVSNKTPLNQQPVQPGQSIPSNGQTPSETSQPSPQQTPSSSNTNTAPGSTVPVNQGTSNQPSNPPQDFIRGY